MKTISNELISERLNEYADVLSQQNANRFRILAYQRAANTVSGLTEPVSRIYARGGIDALVQIPDIGKGIASTIAELIKTGRCSGLERLRGNLDPEQLFQTVPGIGPKLAQRIHDELGIDTLEQLEMAAHDGRLEQLPGFSHRRSQMLRASLGAVLSRPRVESRDNHDDEPDVALLLQVDQEYRDKAGKGELATIAPRRFNPGNEAWLPVLHTVIGPWHFTALFSNTARAHQLGRTRDWVVIYFYNDDHEEGQRTVVTETHGPQKGSRVVRGREREGLP